MIASCASFTGPVEFSSGFAARAAISHVVFDFDGTVSWLRHGWPEMMFQVLRNHFVLRPGETEQALHDLLLDDILSLNGKPSIHQLTGGCERIRERGGVAPDPQVLLTQYQTRLDSAIAARIEEVISARRSPDDFLVFGARSLIEEFHRRKLTLVILSGTPEPRVKEEARLLEISRYFGDHIYGSVGADFSKRGVLDRLIAEEGIQNGALLSFGDGPVEIQHTKELGGVAVGVASDEGVNGSGKLHPQKRKLLLAAGADILIPDYRDAAALIDCIFPK